MKTMCILGVSALALVMATGCPSGVTVEVKNNDASQDMSQDMANNSPDMSSPANNTSSPTPDMSQTSPRHDMPPDAADMGAPDEDMGGAQDMGQEDMGPAGPYEPARYGVEGFHSPITPYVADQLRAVRDRSGAPDDALLIKVGDSNSVNDNMVKCLAEPARVDLAGRDALQATIDYFNMKFIGGAPAFARDSKATSVGKTAAWAIDGSPSPLQAEISEVNPRFALVSYGTNDMQQGSSHQSAVYPFHDNYTALLDQLIAAGIIPIVTGLPPRGDTSTATDWARTYNDVSRAIAEARQIPYIDLLAATEDLPSMGLGADGLHGNSAPQGACSFADDALDYGFNMRNLLTLEALDRTRRVVLEAGDAPEASAPGWRGAGTVQDPILIESFPFSHAGSTSGAASDVFDSYSGCNANQNEGGPEVVYKLEVEKTTKLRVMVFDAPEVDIDLHVLKDGVEPTACIQRDDRFFEISLGAGVYHFVLDTYVSSTKGERAGPYLFVLSRYD